ncbi:MAG: cupredoxin domain-containing protein, partial [Thermoplasmata archaeon]
MGAEGVQRDSGVRPHVRGIAATRLAGILLLTLIVAFLLVMPAPSAQAQVSLTIDLRDVLTFEPNRISVDPGENVTIRVVNSGALQHTFTLFAEVNAQVPVDNNAALQDFYARSTTLVDVDLAGGEETTVNFTAPITEGAYTFVCIVPGHSVGG